MKIIFTSDLSGSDDDNVDFFVEIDGLCYSFVAFTPKNILKMFDTTYSNEKDWVVDGLVVVKKISEECIHSAVNVVVAKGIDRYGVLQQSLDAQDAVDLES